MEKIISHATDIDSSKKKVEHISILDFLRGFAAVSVMFFHFASCKGLVKFSSPILSNLFPWGNRGVDIFFVISGFIIPYSLWNTEYKLKEFLRFMAKRFMRIAPPAYVCLLLIIIQWIIVDSYIKHQVVTRVGELNFVQIIRNLLFQYPLLDPNWINPVFWTLAIEFQFYVIVGLFYNLLFTQKKLWLFIVGFFLLMSGYYFFNFSEYSLSGYAPLFAMGGATLHFKKGTISLRNYLLTLLLFAVVAVSVLNVLSAVLGTASALLIAFAQGRNIILSFFGKISYSLYLMHIMVGSTTEFLLAKVYHPTTELGNLLGIGICVACAIAFAYAFFRYVEMPFMKLARQLKL